MTVRFYLSMWAILAVAAVIVFATGNLTMFAGVVFGFIVFGLTFMGMMNLVPTMAAHPVVPVAPEPEPVAAPVAVEAPAKAFGVLKSA